MAKALVTEVICRYGAMETLISDKGSIFTSKLFREICRLLRIDKIYTTSYHAQSNSMIERKHRDVANIIAKYTERGEDNWCEHVPYVAMAINSQISSATGYSPYQLLFGREIQLPFDAIIAPSQETYDPDTHFPTELHDRLQRALVTTRRNNRIALEKSKRYYDSKSKDVQYRIGDLVYLYTPVLHKLDRNKKFKSFWDGPYRITDNPFPSDYRIVHVYDSKNTQLIHADRLKKFNTFSNDQFNDDMTLRHGTSSTYANPPSDNQSYTERPTKLVPDPNIPSQNRDVGISYDRHGYRYDDLCPTTLSNNGMLPIPLPLPDQAPTTPTVDDLPPPSPGSPTCLNTTGPDPSPTVSTMPCDNSLPSASTAVAATPQHGYHLRSRREAFPPLPMPSQLRYRSRKPKGT
jgi:hypothetical protein